MLIILNYEKEVVIMLNRTICTNAKFTFNLDRINSVFTSKILYDSSTLMKIIFS
jgi:hypothetical protein